MGRGCACPTAPGGDKDLLSRAAGAAFQRDDSGGMAVTLLVPALPAACPVPPGGIAALQNQKPGLLGGERVL